MFTIHEPILGAVGRAEHRDAGRVSQDASILQQFWADDASQYSDPGPATALDKTGTLPLIPLSDALKRALRGGRSSVQKHLGEVLASVVDDEYSTLKAAIAGATS